VVDGLILTSLRGIDTHGVRLFPTYLAELDGGRAAATPEISWSGRAGAALRAMDAGGALGLVAGRIAVDEAIRLARHFGIGGVSVRGSNHFGAASYYTLKMAEHEQIGICCSNSDALVAPWNGRAPLFGTNPMSLAARASEADVFCADFATSQVSYSKVKHLRENGGSLEEGWALDAEGRDAALSEAAEVHALQPLGNHKGQCLSMMVAILTAALSGGPADHQLSHLYTEPFDRPRQVSHLFLSIDPGAVSDPKDFRSRLARLLDTVRAQPTRATTPVVAPGDPEAVEYSRRVVSGIPLAHDELEWFLSLERGGRLRFHPRSKWETPAGGPAATPDLESSALERRKP
jgi:LDH2 family malate/lactate/ureidoglycolate dehydrogenase